MTQSTTKLLAGAAFVALAGIALPAAAQEAPVTAAPAPSVQDTPVVPPVGPPPIVLRSEPAPVPTAPLPSTTTTAPVQSPVQSSVPVPTTAPDITSGLLATQRSLKAATGVTPNDAPATPAEPTKQIKKAAADTKRATTSSATRTTDTTDTRATSARVTPAPTPPATDASATNDAALATQPVPPATQSAAPATDGESIGSTRASQTTASQPDWPLIGGAAALGGIALLGLGAAATTRRRRSTDDTAPLETAATSPATPVVTPEPVSVAPIHRPATEPMPVAMSPVPESPVPAQAPLVADAPGRHMAAAYNGPSPSNPFLTLRARVRRARFLDRQAAAHPAPMADVAARPAPAPQTAPVNQDQTVYVMGKGKAPLFRFRPGWSKS